MTYSKTSNALRVIFSLWLNLSFLLGAVSPVAAQGQADGLFIPAFNNDDVEEAVKALAEQPLTSTPLRLRRLAVETLRPAAREQGGQNTLPLAIVNRIVEDNAAYFFDEGRITQVIVIAHDRELTQRLMALLKDKRVSSDAKQVYLQGLLHLVLADRHMAELAVQDARLIVASARQAGSLKPSDVHQAEAHLNTAELRLRNGLEALRRGDAASAAQHFEKAWEFSAGVQAVWKLTYGGDFDQDGVVDVVEMRLGSSPFDADTDNDGLSDAYELNFLIPHTLPNAADTDNDGLPDGNEDPDEDGLTNRAEQQNGTDPLVGEARQGEALSGNVSPTNNDTDEGGLTDDGKRHLGTAPNAGNSDGVFQETPVPSAEPQGESTPEPTPIPTSLPETPVEPSFRTLAAPALGCEGERCVFQVSGGADDASTDPRFGRCVYTTGANEIYFGQCSNGQNITSGFRFPNVTLPQGAQIAEAYLEFTVDGPYTDELTVVFYGEASGNAQPFSFSSRPENRPLTQASAAWHILSSDRWELGQTRASPDLTAIVQEIINRPDWTSGNALAIIVKNAGPVSGPNLHRRVIGYERPVWYPGREYAARLVILLGAGDSDGDGLSDAQERAGFEMPSGLRVFTDPLQADTDADGLLDGDEVIISGATVQVLADPTQPDTDGDGVEDFVEWRALEAPLQVFDPDSDDDGLSDGEEINEYGTDPLGRDTDGDGVDDGAEIRQNADPLLATERMGALKATHEFLVGAICGEFCVNDPAHGNIAFFSGYLITGAISVIPGGVTQVIGLLADLRDFFAALASGDWTSLGLNALALLPWVGDAADVPATIGKFLLKHADLVGEVGAFLARLDWLPESARAAGILAAFGEEAFNALVNRGLDAAKLQRLSKAGVNLARLNEALEPLARTYPGLVDYLRLLPVEAIDESTGILRVSGNSTAPGLTVNLKGLAAAQQAGDAKRVASYLGNLKAAYTQWLVRNERLAQGWQVIQEAAHVNAPGYDLVLNQGGVYRLVEAKARTSLSLTDLRQYVRKHKVTGELRFNAEYFLENLTSLNPNARQALLRSGNLEIEFYLNGPESARLAQELLTQMGGTIARYEFEGRDHEVRIILTAVSQ